MKDIYIKDSLNFYSRVSKYINKNKYIIHFIYKDYDIIDDGILTNNKFSDDIKWKIYFVCAINIKNINDRYSYIYDVVCDYLDNEFSKKNICKFKNNKCISVLNKSHCPSSCYGCCYGDGRGLCKYFINGKCSIKSISCKLFTCRYLKKHNIRYKINDIVLLKYFFNPIQKYIIYISIFKDKDEIINLLFKYRFKFI